MSITMSERTVLVFDVNETLLDLETLRPMFDRLFDDPAAMRLWFAGLITYSEALTLAGVYVSFTDIGGVKKDPPRALTISEPRYKIKTGAQSLSRCKRAGAPDATGRWE